jgi:hypothetical protein
MRERLDHLSLSHLRGAVPRHAGTSRHQGTPVHQSAKPIDVVLRTAQGDFGHRPLRSIDKILIERLRKPLPKTPRLRCANRCTRRLIDGNDAHRALSYYSFPDAKSALDRI